MATAQSAATTLTLRAVTKRYGTFTACRDVAFEVRAGEVVGLLGQNGAGKSTLMKVVSGIETYESGQVGYAGETLRSGDHAHARALGIAMVHQEFSLVGPLTVWENVALGLGGALRRRWTIGRIRELSGDFGLALGDVVDSKVDSLPLATRQRIEIAKCLVTEPRLILLDEPTAILSREEARRLFQIVRRLVEESGAAVLVSNHRLDEILDVTDRVVVLREGRVTGAMPTREATEAILAREMLGDDFDRYADAPTLLGLDELAPAGSRTVVARRGPRGGATRPDRAPAGVTPPDALAKEAAGPALAIDRLTVARPNGAPALDGLSLSVRRGEIVGIVGVEGNGQVELVDVLAGRRRPTAGAVTVGAAPGSSRRGHRAARAVGVVPADRHGHGCVLAMSVAENLFLGRLHTAERHGIVRRRVMHDEARRLIADFAIQCAGPDAPMWTLSGGHQQRVVLARELMRRPSLLVVDQPTRGLDVAAVEAVWGRIREAASRGIGVLIVSSDLDEILNLCSRILVISRGAITGELEADQVDAESLGLLIGGVGARASA